jgi:hypothetical protein
MDVVKPCRRCGIRLHDGAALYLSGSNLPTVRPVCRRCYERLVCGAPDVSGERVLKRYGGQRQRAPGTAQREYEDGPTGS